MAIVAQASKVHWNYFLALEHDLELAGRYVEFAEDNMGTYSIEFAHLLLAASSEVDAVAKLLCQRLDADAPRANIEHYRLVLSARLPELIGQHVYVPRYGLTLTPWDNWRNGENPNWWRSHNNVKHERDVYFSEATLKNSFNAVAALLTVVFHYYRHSQSDGVPLIPKEANRILQPQSTLLRFSDDHYYGVRITA